MYKLRYFKIEKNPEIILNDCMEIESFKELIDFVLSKLSSNTEFRYKDDYSLSIESDALINYAFVVTNDNKKRERVRIGGEYMAYLIISILHHKIDISGNYFQTFLKIVFEDKQSQYLQIL